jgi:hypothetical protein
MTANVYETATTPMFYSLRKPAWHALREPSQIEKSAVRVIEEEFQGAFSIENRPITVTLNGVPTETGDFAIIRCTSKADPKEIVFDYCTEKYHPLQPIQVAEIFDASVCEPAETVVFLGNGEDMFITWKMPSFEVRVGDDVDMYGLIRTGFDTKHGTKLFTSTVRAVCQNTIVQAENWARANTNKEENKGMIWTGKGVNRNLARDMGYWMEHVQTKAIAEANLVQSFFSKLTAIPVKNDAHLESILNTAYPNKVDNSQYGPWQLRGEASAKVTEFNRGQSEIRDGIKQLFLGTGTAITPDYWGLTCAVSEWACHIMPSKKPIAESIMFGGRQKMIGSMISTLQKSI